MHAGVPALPRLRRLTGTHPDGSVLAQRLGYLVERLAGDAHDNAAALLPNYSDWGPGRAAGAGRHRPDHEPYPKLKVNQRRALWSVIESANDIAAARRLLALDPAAPPQFSVRLWLAGWAVQDGRVDAA